MFEELDEDGDGQVSFNEFLHGLFAAKDFQQSDIEPEWEQQQQSTPYNQAPPANFTSKVRVSHKIRIRHVLVINIYSCSLNRHVSCLVLNLSPLCLCTV